MKSISRWVACFFLFFLGIQFAEAYPQATFIYFPKICNKPGGIRFSSVTSGFSEGYYLHISKSGGSDEEYVVKFNDGGYYNIYLYKKINNVWEKVAPSNSPTDNYSYTDCYPYIPLPAGSGYSYQIGFWNSTGGEFDIGPTLPLDAITDATSSHPLSLSASYSCEQGYMYLEWSSNISFGIACIDGFYCDIYVDGMYFSRDGASDNLYAWPQGFIPYSGPYWSVGTHTVTMTNSFGCTASAQFTVNELPLINYNVSIIKPSCRGTNDGSAQINVASGHGTPPLQYKWSGQSSYQTSNIFSGLPSGAISFDIKSATGCVLHTSFNQSQSTPISPGTPTIASPSCVGGNDGSITVNGTTGGAGVSSGVSQALYYSIDGGASYPYYAQIPTISGLAAGNYNVTIKDGNNCTASVSNIQVNNPVPITAGYTSVPASCATVNDGSLTITSPAGGTGSYTYSFNNGAFGVATTFTNLAAGSSYILKVKDSNGCVFTINNASVGLKPAVTGTISQTATINCNGQSTAALTIAPSGGTSPYSSYSWTNGSTVVGTAQSISSLSAGSYNVTITDSKGCTGTAGNGPFTVTQPSVLSATATAINVLCKGGSTGGVNLAVSGGTGTKTFLWSNGAITQNLSGLTAGTYSVTVTDANNCTASASVAVTEPASSVSVSLQFKTNVSCFGGSNGTITVNASGGTGAFSYSKEGIAYQGSPIFSGLTAGNYTITAKDVNGCIATTSGISITQPASAVSIGTIIKNNPLCYGTSTGSLTISASGGTAPYQYSVDGTNFTSSSTISGLTAGNYVVTVRDANGCIISSSTQSLNNPPAISASANTSPQSCAAIIDGKITVTASGGTGSLLYSLNASTYQMGNQFTNLSSGAYTVTVKDGNNCTVTTSANVGMVAPIAGTIGQSAFINCFGQSTAALNLSVTGGTPGYTYAWSNGATSQNLSALAAGLYAVNITDTKGCTGSTSFTVTQPALLTASAIKSSYNGFGVSCTGSSDGFINLTVAGGSSPYTYSWSNGATIKDIAALASGTYNVTVTDSKSCTTNASAVLTSPASVSLSLSGKTNASCYGTSTGSITVSGSGGTGVYNYSIDGGISWQASNIFSTLPQGSYSIKSRDQNNCLSATPLSVVLTEPTVISIALSNYVEAICGQPNGSVQAAATGGTGALSYEWRNSSNAVVGNGALLANVVSGVYTVTVSDASGCTKTQSATVGAINGAQFTVGSITGVTCPTSNDGKAQVTITGGVAPFTVTWSSMETGASATVLTAGDNTAFVKDGNNCTVAANFTVPSPAPITLSSVITTSPDCVGGSNGSIQVTAAGGSGSYTYQWNGNTGTNSLANVAAGTYVLEVKDSKNCLMNQNVVLNDITPISISVINQVMPTCADTSDGSVIVSATGGNGGFSYSWNDGTTGPFISSLAGGSYSVTAKDSKNCTQTETIHVAAPAAVQASVSTYTIVSCHGNSDGSVILSGAGGTGNFDYSINSGNTWQSASTFNNLSAGTLNIKLRDANGCVGSSTFFMTEPSVLINDVVDIVNTKCNLPNGSASVSTFGGTTPYTYRWLNSANEQVSVQNILEDALAGDYQLIVKDKNQCTTTSSFSIAPSTNSEFTVTNVSATNCSYSSDGSAGINIISVRSPYAVLWSSGETATIANKLPGGSNRVSITDRDGCVASTIFTIPTAVPITILSEFVQDPLCHEENGSIQVSVTGGLSPYNYQWDGQPGSSLNQTKAGLHQLTVNDAKGCTFTKTYTLIDPPAFVIDLGPDKTVCTGTSVTIGATLDNTTYVWSGPTAFQSTAGTVTIQEAGIYKVEATDSKGCKATDSFQLNLSENLLKADLLAVRNAFVKDTIVVIDISWPLPEVSRWKFDEGVTVIYSDSDYAMLSFSNTGVYTIGVDISTGDCKSTYRQSIRIEERDAMGGRVTNEEKAVDINLLNAYPNPFDKIINIELKMSQQAAVDFKILHLLSNELIYSRQLSDSNHYQLEIDFSRQPSGIYAIVATIDKEHKTVRIVKK